jgi:hypothetical protein
MALTPKLALGNKPDELKKRVDKHEKSLDFKLAAEYNGRNSVTLSMPYNEDEWVVDQLKSRFKAVGWHVEVKKYAGSQWGDDNGSTSFTVSAQADLE